MSLSTVVDVYKPAVTGANLTGYKVAYFDEITNTLEFENGSSAIQPLKTYKASGTTIKLGGTQTTANGRKVRTYPAGFHVFATEKAARQYRDSRNYPADYTILKVNVDRIVANGTEIVNGKEVPVIVARELTVPGVGHVKQIDKAVASVYRSARRKLGRNGQ